jgi:hypothetical protein
LVFTFSHYGETLPTLFEHRTILVNEPVVKFPLEVINLIKVNEAEIPSDYLHLFFINTSKSVPNWYEMPTVKLGVGKSYTMKNILYNCIDIILAKFQLSFHTAEQEHQKEIEYLTTEGNNMMKLLCETRVRIARSSELVKRFINNFVSVVNSVREEIEAERAINSSDFIEHKYIFIYCMLASATHVQENKSCIIGVFPAMSRQFTVMSNPSFYRVQAKSARHITVAICNETGRPYRFKPSVTPNYISLRFVTTAK